LTICKARSAWRALRSTFASARGRTNPAGEDLLAELRFDVDSAAAPVGFAQAGADLVPKQAQ
jgi:hypothetical protein